MCPVFRGSGCYQTEVLFHPLVLSLRDAIGLGVESRQQVLIDLEFLGYASSKVRCEAGVSVGDNLGRESEPLVDMV